MLKLALSYFLLLPLLATAQKPPYRHSFSITTENDAYLLMKNDAYYTNGIFFGYNWLKQGKKRTTVHSLQLGQMIFTPLIRKTEGPGDIDRPYCGYLFLEYARSHFTDHRIWIRYRASVSELGAASLGEALQNGYHSLFNYGKFTGWQYQVRNATGVNGGIDAAKPLSRQNNWWQIIPAVTANLGTDFINTHAGGRFCIGKLQSPENSVLFNNGVSTSKQKPGTEIFVYWQPELLWQGFNATIQGGLLQKGNGAVLGTPETWMYQEKTGVMLSAGRWITDLSVVYQSKEAVKQTRPQRYGSVRVCYRL